MNKHFPRAIKYLLERITLEGPGEDAEQTVPSLDKIDETIIFAEQFVSYCILSDQTRQFPKSTTITLLNPQTKNFLEHTVSDPRISDLQVRADKDAKIRDSLFEGPSYELDFKVHAEKLDPLLQETIGATYTEILQILATLVSKSKPIPNSKQKVKFISLSSILSGLSKQFNKSPEVIEKILSGFWLNKEVLSKRAKNKAEDLWKPSNEYRAYRRALFVMDHSSGPHVAFCDRMFIESMTFFQSAVSFGSISPEWQSTSVRTALGQIDTSRGHWFEKQIHRNMTNLGIFGLASRRSIGTGVSALELPGEFDYLGWSENDRSLVLIEAKMFQPASEPGLWKNQCDKFIEIKENQENHVQKLRRKSSWLVENAALVKEALRTVSGDQKARKIGGLVRTGEQRCAAVAGFALQEKRERRHHCAAFLSFPLPAASA